MPRVVQLGLVIALAASAVFGQGRGLPPGNPLGNPLPPVGPIPSLAGSPRPPAVPLHGARRTNFYPLSYSPVAYDPLPYYPAASPAPGVTIIQQFSAPPAAAIPETPVTPHIQEYPSPASTTAPLAEPVLFSIVLKDGSVLLAAAVMTQENALQIVDADGQHRRVPLNAIDREATRRRNAERNLRLQLPPPSAP